MKKILISLHCALALIVLSFAVYPESRLLARVSAKIEYQVQFTPVPSLYENWRRAVIEEDMHKRPERVSDREFLRYVQKQKENRVRTLNPRFLDIARMTPAQREIEGERVLWENEKIMILVDTKIQAPKLLVVAKIEDVWLITDADLQLRQDMAIVAVAASDALIEAANRGWKPENASEIEIHSIRQIEIQQLHIHVEPKWKLKSRESDIPFYEGVKRSLVDKLGKGSSN